MQFYMYDFSEFVNIDVQEDGLFEAYKFLDEYWKDNNRFPYIIQKDKTYAGFILVRFIESAQRKYFSIAEFFVMKKYRRAGIGKTIAHQVFNLHKGDWEVFQKENNKPAQLFWNKVIDEYTKGNFKERFEDGKRIQDFIS
jgi:predicted acetyltransferase